MYILTRLLFLQHSGNLCENVIYLIYYSGNVKEEWLLSDKSESDVKVINPEDEHRTPENKSEITIVQPKKINFVKKHFRSKSADFDHRIISSLNNNFLPLLKPPVLTETPKFETKHKIDENDFDTSPEKQPSTQKRKVGRPKKLMPFSKEQVTTETIVSKKPKSNLIGYFLAAKEKFRLQNKESLCENTDRYVYFTWNLFMNVYLFMYLIVINFV